MNAKTYTMMYFAQDLSSLPKKSYIIIFVVAWISIWAVFFG